MTLSLALSLSLGVEALSAQTEEPTPSPAPASGGSRQEAPPPGRSTAVSRDEFRWSIGAGVIASPRPYVGTRARIFPIPAFGLEYKRWFVQGIRGGYHFLRSGRFRANVFAQARFQGLEPGDSAFLEGMEERKKSLDGGVELVFNARPVGFRAAVLSDVLGRSQGQEVSLLAVSGVPLGRRGIVLVGFGPRWLSRNRVDYYYGVRETEATPFRPSYSGESTWNWDLNVTAVLNVTTKWSFLALLNREGLGSNITESPLVDRESAYSLITAINYNF